MRIGIVGGGLMGLALAERLTAMGHRVEVFERATQPGGLATWQDFGRFVWDRFYHVILPSDTFLLDYLRRLGLGEEMRWARTRTGYYVDGTMHSLSNGMEFLRFRPLSLWSKFRLAATILYCSRLDDWRRLERITVEDFLVRTSGRATFDKFWKPLLLAKLGDSYRRVSAVFIWTYIKRLFSARDATTQKEQLGYVRGGYRVVFERIMDRIQAGGGTVRLGIDVSAVEPSGARALDPGHASDAHSFDKVVFTGPVNVMRAVVDRSLVDAAAATDVEYLGVVCLVLVTRRPIVPYYIVNISDPSIPFTGVIGMSSLVATSNTDGLYLTYLPKYVLSTDAYLKEPDERIESTFIEGLRKMCPHFDPVDIELAAVHRAVKVQPLQVVGYSDLVQQSTTRSPDFYVVNTAQFVSNTLNNNEVVRAVQEFLAAHAADFEERTVRDNDAGGIVIRTAQRIAT